MKPLDLPPQLSDTEIQTTISQANDVIMNIEGSRDRLNRMLKEPLEVSTRKKLRAHTFTLQFISGVLVAMVLVLAMFGVLLFKMTDALTYDNNTHDMRLSQAEAQIARQQTLIRSLEQKLGIDPNRPQP
jgi:hypothetical protein